MESERIMVTVEITFLQSQLEERKRRLEQAIALTPRSGSLAGLLRGFSARTHGQRQVRPV
jgi:hypothetical protein